MKYVSLMPHHYDLSNHPVAKRIDDIMHDGLNNSCINYLDINTLKNRLGDVDSRKLRAALQYLSMHHEVTITRYKGQTLISL